MRSSRCGRRSGKHLLSFPSFLFLPPWLSHSQNGIETNRWCSATDRYHELLFMIDTCQANTMYSKLYSPNIIATGSSEIDQSSYSHHADNDVGVAVIDRYTYYNLEFLETEVREKSSKKTLGDLFDSYDDEKIHSHAGIRYDLFPGGSAVARERLLMDFFGNVQNVEVDAGNHDGNTNGNSNSTAWKEDLALLGRKIAMLRELAVEEEQNASLLTNAPLVAPPLPPPMPKRWAAKVEMGNGAWDKKIVGVLALAGTAAAWAAGSYLESVR
jgi:hypothetical protein